MARVAPWPWRSSRTRIDAPARIRLAAVLLLILSLSSAAHAQAPLQDFSAFGLGPTASAGRPQTGLSVIPVTLRPAGRNPLVYQVEVAATPGQQAIGMMFRRTMPPKTGMLFPMHPPRKAAFWMRNTFIPLDLVFVGPDHRIIHIHHSARPLNDDPLPSGGPVIAVLELAGGESKRIGLASGDRVDW